MHSANPCFIMGHGFGGTKDMGLESYAIRFLEADFAVLIFDYRHLGESEGEPRQLIWIPYQLEGWSSAIAYARGLKQIDPAKIALWGTFLRRGHVIATAAKDNQIACVVAQCPGLDGRTSGEMFFDLLQVHAIFMPDAAQTVNRLPPGLSCRSPNIRSFDTVSYISTPPQRFAYAHLLDPYLTRSSPCLSLNAHHNCSVPMQLKVV